MTGLMKCTLKGYEEVQYTRQKDGKFIKGRRLSFVCEENPDQNAVGSYCGCVFTTENEAQQLLVGDDIIVFRDDFSRQSPLRYVPSY